VRWLIYVVSHCWYCSWCHPFICTWILCLSVSVNRWFGDDMLSPVKLLKRLVWFPYIFFNKKKSSPCAINSYTASNICPICSQSNWNISACRMRDWECLLIDNLHVTFVIHYLHLEFVVFEGIYCSCCWPRSIFAGCRHPEQSFCWLGSVWPEWRRSSLRKMRFFQVAYSWFHFVKTYSAKCIPARNAFHS
jgi:hypothetical protein